MRRGHMLSILLAVALSGCALQRASKPPPETPFLEGVEDQSVEISGGPFQRVWTDPDFEPDGYDKVYIAPVDLSHLPDDGWRGSADVSMGRSSYRRAVERLAQYMQQAFRDRFRKSDTNRFKVVDSVDLNTLVIEIALTEAVLERPVAYAAALAVPFPGTTQLFDIMSSPSLAFAMRVRSGRDGKIVAAVSDRKFPPVRLVDLKKLTASGPAREVVNGWADMTVAAFNEERIRRPTRFSLLPW